MVPRENEGRQGQTRADPSRGEALRRAGCGFSRSLRSVPVGARRLAGCLLRARRLWSVGRSSLFAAGCSFAGGRWPPLLGAGAASFVGRPYRAAAAAALPPPARLRVALRRCALPSSALRARASRRRRPASLLFASFPPSAAARTAARLASAGVCPRLPLSALVLPWYHQKKHTNASRRPCIELK